jgi:hypothetical protein
VQVEVEGRQAVAMEPIALASTPADIAYVEARFVTFDRLACGVPGERDWAGSELPQATYRTPDGALWFARDWWRLFDDAGGVASVRLLFERRLAAAAGRIGYAVDVASEWDAYVAGLYGACLREVTPENMALKEFVAGALEQRLGDPRPQDGAWCAALRADVETLDGLTKPFAACDRIRFGKPTSRDRLITDVRARFTHVFV